MSEENRDPWSALYAHLALISGSFAASAAFVGFWLWLTAKSGAYQFPNHELLLFTGALFFMGMSVPWRGRSSLLWAISIAPTALVLIILSGSWWLGLILAINFLLVLVLVALDSRRGKILASLELVAYLVAMFGHYMPSKHGHEEVGYFIPTLIFGAFVFLWRSERYAWTWSLVLAPVVAVFNWYVFFRMAHDASWNSYPWIIPCFLIGTVWLQVSFLTLKETKRHGWREFAAVVRSNE